MCVSWVLVTVSMQDTHAVQDKRLVTVQLDLKYLGANRAPFPVEARGPSKFLGASGPRAPVISTPEYYTVKQTCTQYKVNNICHFTDNSYFTH